MTANKEISRRDFLRLAGASVAYAALRPGGALDYALKPEQQEQQMVQWKLPMYQLDAAESSVLRERDRSMVALQLRRNESTAQLEAVLPITDQPGFNHIFTQSKQLYEEQVNFNDGNRRVVGILPSTDLTNGIGDHLTAIESRFNKIDGQAETHGIELTLAVKDGQAGVVLWTREPMQLDAVSLSEGSAVVFEGSGQPVYLNRTDIAGSEVVVTELGQNLADWLRINHGIDTDPNATTIVQRDTLTGKPYVILLENQQAFVIPPQWWADNEGRDVNLRSSPTAAENNVVGKANFNVAVEVAEASPDMIEGVSNYYTEYGTIKVQNEGYVWMLVWVDKAQGQWAWVATNDGLAPAKYVVDPNLPPTQVPYTKSVIHEQSSLETNAYIVEIIPGFSVAIKPEATLSSPSYTIRFSEELLNSVGINSVALDSVVLESVYQQILNKRFPEFGLSRDAAVKFSGVKIDHHTGNLANDQRIEGVVTRVVQTVVTPEQLDMLMEIIDTTQIQHVDFDFHGETPDTLAWFGTDGVLYVVNHAPNRPVSAEQKSFLIVKYGPGMLEVFIGGGLMRANGGVMNNYNVDYVYEALGCNRNNDFCRNGNQGLLEVQ